MSGYPGFQGNQMGGGGSGGNAFASDVEMGAYPPQQQQQQQYYSGGGYGGQPQQQYGGGGKPSYYGAPPPQQQPTPSYGYAAPHVTQPPPRPQPQQSQYIADMELATRHGFIRKVYGILFVQLLVTFGLVIIFSYIPDLQEYAINNSWLMGVSIAATFGILIALVCCPGNLVKRFPANIILLLTFSVFQGFALGCIAATYACDSLVRKFDGTIECIVEPNSGVTGKWAVLFAIGVTMLVVIVLTVFACQTKYDFTGFGPYLCAGLLIFFVFFLVAGIFFRFNQVMNLVYASLGVLLFSGLLIYDTQLVVGGKNRKYQLGPDDYIFGALSLYLDIINMFLFILTIVGNSR